MCTVCLSLFGRQFLNIYCISSINNNGKCSKILNTFLSLFSKMLVFSAGIHQFLVRIANREDHDQTASESLIWVCPVCLGIFCLPPARKFPSSQVVCCSKTSVRKFRTFMTSCICCYPSSPAATYWFSRQLCLPNFFI